MSEKISPVKAIRAKCIDCCVGEMAEVRNCQIEKCPLYPFRMGKNPYRSRNMSEEQKQKVADRLKKSRAQGGSK